MEVWFGISTGIGTSFELVSIEALHKTNSMPQMYRSKVYPTQNIQLTLHLT